MQCFFFPPKICVNCVAYLGACEESGGWMCGLCHVVAMCGAHVLQLRVYIVQCMHVYGKSDDAHEGVTSYVKGLSYATQVTYS